MRRSAASFPLCWSLAPKRDARSFGDFLVTKSEPAIFVTILPPDRAGFALLGLWVLHRDGVGREGFRDWNGDLMFGDPLDTALQDGLKADAVEGWVVLLAFAVVTHHGCHTSALPEGDVPGNWFVCAGAAFVFC